MSSEIGSESLLLDTDATALPTTTTTANTPMPLERGESENENGVREQPSPLMLKKKDKSPHAPRKITKVDPPPPILDENEKLRVKDNLSIKKMEMLGLGGESPNSNSIQLSEENGNTNSTTSSTTVPNLKLWLWPEENENTIKDESESSIKGDSSVTNVNVHEEIEKEKVQILEKIEILEPLLLEDNPASIKFPAGLEESESLVNPNLGIEMGRNLIESQNNDEEEEPSNNNTKNNGDHYDHDQDHKPTPTPPSCPEEESNNSEIGNGNELRNKTAEPEPTPTSSSSNSSSNISPEEVEKGLFCASETCNVLLHTVFRESLGNPASLERVLESREFNSFLHSMNEVDALEKCSGILAFCGKVIEEYVDGMKKKKKKKKVKECENEIQKNKNENFPTPIISLNKKIASPFSYYPSPGKSSNSKKSLKDAKTWNFIPPSEKPLQDLSCSEECYKLALFHNPESGEVLQTITCQDHVFRTRYATSPLQGLEIRRILSSSREQVGLPAFLRPESLLETIVCTSSTLLGKLERGSTLIGKVSGKLMTTVIPKLKKEKYAISQVKLKNLDKLRISVQQLNIFSGILYQLSSEIREGCERLRGSLWSMKRIQKILNFPRIPAATMHKVPGEVGEDETNTNNEDDAMLQLIKGIKGIDQSLRTSQFSMETLKLGTKIKKDGLKKLLTTFIEGVKSLGNEKDVDFGSLLVTLRCSVEMMNTFEDEVGPHLTQKVRSLIIRNLGKLGWDMTELINGLKNVEYHSKLLTMRSIFKLREIRNRYKREYGYDL